jgi:hypothetical protein
MIAVMSTVPVMGLVTMMSVVPWNLEDSDFSYVHDEFYVCKREAVGTKKGPKVKYLIFSTVLPQSGT